MPSYRTRRRAAMLKCKCLIHVLCDDDGFGHAEYFTSSERLFHGRVAYVSPRARLSL